MKLKHTLIIACLGTELLCAQQAEPKPDVPKSGTSPDNGNTATPATRAAGTDRPDTRHPGPHATRHHHRDNPGPSEGTAAKTPEQKPAPYIGVMTRGVSPELRAQFSLSEGFGLVVDEVMPDSPAAHAGVKVHDILVKLDDQRLVSMEQLMLLVRSKHKGDNVSLALITGGKETTVSVMVDEHVMPAMQPRMQHDLSGWPHHFMPLMNNGGFGGFGMRGLPNQDNEFNEQMERFHKELREYQQRIQDWARQGSNGIMPQPPMFNMPGNSGQPQHGAPRVNGGAQTQPPGHGGVSSRQLKLSESHSSANITRRDDSGEYTIKREDGKTTFTARPDNGKEQSWPVNNDTERNSVPPEFRDKLRMMEGTNGGIRIEVRPGPDGGGTPRPAPGGTSQPSPPAKNSKPATSA